jgi:hypothetical protein
VGKKRMRHSSGGLGPVDFSAGCGEGTWEQEFHDGVQQQVVNGVAISLAKLVHGRLSTQAF